MKMTASLDRKHPDGYRRVYYQRKGLCMSRYENLVRRYVRSLDPLPVSAPAGILTRKEKIDTVLFDIYGTLVISEAGDIAVAEEASMRNEAEIDDLLKRYGIMRRAGHVSRAFYEEISATKEKMRCNGVDYPEVIVERIWHTVLRIHNEDILRRFAIEYELIVNAVAPMPHAGELLAFLRDNQVYSGIISNAQFYTPCLFPVLFGGDLTRLGFSPDLCIFSYRWGRCKPSPVLFNGAVTALAEKGIKPANTLYVGNDMLKDIMPAAQVGFQTALFAGDARSLRLREDDESCAALQPDYVVSDLSQIHDLIRDGRMHV